MKKIRLILSGGGTRCAYQLGFIENLYNNQLFITKHKIDEIYGTSFGAFVGFFICLERFDLINSFFSNMDEYSLKPCFDLWGLSKYIKKIPYVGNIFGTIIDIVWIIVGIQKKGLYTPSYGVNFLKNIELTEQDINKLSNYYCCVYNITKEKIEFINGTHLYIKDYLIASSALWIVFPPVKIPQLKSECVCDENCLCWGTKQLYPDKKCNCLNKKHRINEFIDGGIIKQTPFIYDDKFDGTYLILNTKNMDDVIKKKLYFNTGSHIFDYLDNLITFLIDNNQYYDIKYNNNINNNNIKIINYISPTTSATNLDQVMISKFKSDGIELSDDFIISL
jgi:predicted acylesterase/phospholipase RssA